MKKIAIIGTGPTGIYTLFSLIKNNIPLCISLFEKAALAGVGMPYREDDNSNLMLANIASIEIPAITTTYLQWLLRQNETFLARFGVNKHTLHDRQFLPRILLGQYFKDQLFELVNLASALGFKVSVYKSCKITDIEASTQGVKLWHEGMPDAKLFDFAVIATGHVWPDSDKANQHYFPSPWSGLLGTKIPAGKIGIMGTSLSAIDAAMAVVAQHGEFVKDREDTLRFDLAPESQELSITLMSRSGILPEADFYCPIPYEPLIVATQHAIENEIAAGSKSLLDRIFKLVTNEITLADPIWSKRLALHKLNADSFSEAYFQDRKGYDSFRWAQYNLAEVERNRQEKRTVAWRYAILRLHEAVQEIVPYLDDSDRERFTEGLCKVFIDNYAAIPPESIRRLLALRDAGVVDILALGHDYAMDLQEQRTVIFTCGKKVSFDVFIDARGQRPLQTKDLPFPRLRQQLILANEDVPQLGDDYSLLAPRVARGRIAFAALPYLMKNHPFIQGITASAAIGEIIAQAAMRSALRTKKHSNSD